MDLLQIEVLFDKGYAFHELLSSFHLNSCLNELDKFGIVLKTTNENCE